MHTGPSSILLTDFRSLRPAHTIGQAESLAWIAAAHGRAEATAARRDGRELDEAAFVEHTAKRLARFGCDEDKIAARGHELGDCAHRRWSEMEIYRLDEEPEGAGMLARSRAFDAHALDVLERLYAERETPPADLVHVTCTGYVSPSAAQRLVAARGWGDATRVTHAYHMGCYAAFPALRMACGFASADAPLRAGGPRRADVAHTEMCSLHLNPTRHEPEQLVVQSLFADGFLAYTACDASTYDGRSPALTLLAQDELVVPDSAGSMSWICGEHGMRMTLARDVPPRLTAGVRAFVERLAERAGLTEDERRTALYAVHPGGPKILDGVRDALAIDEAQIAFSRRALLARGNMSSATIPHVWMDIAGAREVEDGRPIVSLAFGPGLTMCGTIFRKGAR